MREYATSFTVDVPVVTTTETVVMTLPPITTSGAGDTVVIDTEICMTMGTGTTSLTPRIRRGTTITGTLVSEANPLSYTAGQSWDIGFQAVDHPGEVAGQSYVLTMQQTGATANGTALYGSGLITVMP